MVDIIIGIDPGKTGGLCALRVEDREVVELIPMLEWEFFTDWVEKFAVSWRTHAFLELAQSRPGNAAQAMFNYGAHFGDLRTTLKILRVPHTLVPPQTWCKVLHTGCKAGKPKDKSRQVAPRLFPGVKLTPEGSRSLKAHEGMMDALLIAEYGRRLMAKS